MSKQSTALVGAMLAAAGFALGHWSAAPERPAQRAELPGERERLGEARFALADIVRTRGSLDGVQRLAQRLEQLGPEAIPAIPPILLHPGEAIDGPRALVLLQFWIDRDPDAAAKWIKHYAPTVYQSLALGPAVERIAERDPGAAVNLVGRAGGADKDLIKPFVRGWVRSGRPGVEDWIRNLGYGFKRQMAFGAFWRAKIEKDGADAAIAWLDALPEHEDGFYEEAFGRLASELAYADPEKAVAWYERHRDGPLSTGLMMSVVDAWVAVDGPAAMRWVAQQPEGRERDHAVLDGVRRWGMADPAGLNRWAAEMGADSLDDAWFQPGLSLFAKFRAVDAPLDGLRWAERIGYEPTRMLTLTQIARNWYASDPAEAEAWLAQSPLSEADRERARSPRAAAVLKRRAEADPAPAPAD